MGKEYSLYTTDSISINMSTEMRIYIGLNPEIQNVIHCWPSS